MSKIVVGVDPGTKNTGYCKLEVNNDGTVRTILSLERISPTGDTAVSRIPEIVERVCEGVVGEPKADEVWTELFVPYGARKGAMWNASLVGALLFLPVTRMIKNLGCYGVYPVQWKSWAKKIADVPMTEVIGYLLAKDNIELTDEQNLALSNPHVADAMGLALFGIRESDKHEYKTC